MSRRQMELRHPDGDTLKEVFVQQWFCDRLDRIREYFLLGDAERVRQHVAILSEAVASERIPAEAYFDVR